MKKETTYQKYKRENQQMRNILALEIFRFGVSHSNAEHLNRLNYLKRCIERYRV